MTEHCSKLRTLVLRGGKRLGQSSATRLGRWKGLSKLSALDLMGCYRILTDSAIAAIFGGECFADGQLDGGQPKTLTLTDLNLSRRSNLVDSR